jgi:membrane protease YdiL (CAAX protease family)
MSSDSQIIREFIPPPEPLVPVPEPLVPPPESPPARRGWPKTAWGVILLIVTFIVTSHYLPVKQVIARIIRGRANEDPPVVTKSEPAPSNATLALRMQGQLLVAFFNWTQRSDPQYLQSALALDSGPPLQRLSVAVLAGELGSPVKALEQLAKLKDEQASNDIVLTLQEEETLKTLTQLYTDLNNDRWDAPSVNSEDKAALRAELGWFGDLALAPPGAPAAEREAVLKSAYRFTIALLGGTGTALTLCFIGLLGLFLMLLLGLLGYLRGCLQRGSLHGGVYAETFALWLIVFMVLTTCAVLLAPGGWTLIYEAAAILLTLSVLAWPVIRGIPWQQVRRDIGWTMGRAGRAEPFVGIWTFILSMPLAGVGLLITGVLILIAKRVMGENDVTNPSHPVQQFMSEGNWWGWFQIFLVASIVAPIVEETMFRGVLYRQMRQATSPRGRIVSILLSTLVVSFIFAVIHPQGLLAVPGLMFIAFGLTLAREWRGSLLPGMVEHGLHNGCIMVVAMLLFNS